MIVGIGHDLTSIDRIQSIMESDAGQRFAARVLTDGELEISGCLQGVRKMEFIAGRFASKEAVSKAFGCGIGSRLTFRDIEVGKDPAGKPECRLSDEAWERLGHRPEHTFIHITITHERHLASAFVVVERTV